ncbi:MAG: hypothetical protein GWO02_11760 [Gammaproteobacteria bacterium]|nr:hypothetical protein [Gammaproteobacteria bacterium]
MGTWPELLEQARRAYLVARPGWIWEEVFRGALQSMKDAFWSRSYAVAPEETALAVEAALRAVIESTAPDRALDTTGMPRLPERPRRHVADLLRLRNALDGALPEDLAAITALLHTSCDDAIQSLRVYWIEDWPRLSIWQRAPVEKLNADSQASADVSLDRILQEAGSSEARGKGALGWLQEKLFAKSDERAALDESVQWIGVRDALQEAEVAAGMAQRMLEQHRDLAPADIGLLVPEDEEYVAALRDAFSLAGLPLSGLPVARRRRDLGREAVLHFLYCRQKPTPAMALAACLTSPLMPWSGATGASLAQAVMDRDYRLRAPAGASSETRRMLALMREGDESPTALATALSEFASLLRGEGDLSGHWAQAERSAAQVCGLLDGADRIDWNTLHRVVTPHYLAADEEMRYTREGVTVLREHHEPWRAVRHLVVLGFSAGRYPVSPPPSPVFASDELEAIRDRLALPLETPRDILQRRRHLFRRQLAAASESASFLVPRRNGLGETQAPSQSLVFMHRLLDGPDDAGDLVLDLDAHCEREQVRHLKLASPGAARPPRALVAEDLRFGRDLLRLRVDEQGEPKPESPSSLETLMVSPLAWLLRRLGAEPLEWAPEAPDPPLRGSLAHRVFEDLFRPEGPLPDPDALPDQVRLLLDAAIREMAPFLRGSQWRVERRHLHSELTEAAVAWRELVEKLGAGILGTEIWLAGRLGAVPVHGQADTVLGLSGERLLVVDYKKASAKGRRSRMERGFDSQASLYRTMLETGGPKDEGDRALVARLERARQRGIVYFMMNDRRALSDTTLEESARIPEWTAAEQDVSGNALALIGERLRQARQGLVRLNREGDERYFEKEAGFRPYALEVSPLIRIFMRPSEENEGQAA